MTYKSIDMNHFPRIKHFNYFKSLAYPYVGTTVNVEITAWFKAIKAQDRPFFHSFLYAVTRAANGVPEFRQRIEGEGIIEFDKCLSSYTLALDDGTYCYCTVDCSQAFQDYLPYAQNQQALAKAEATVEDGESVQSLFFISSLPWLTYTNIIQPVPMPADSNPRITWGRYFKDGDKWLMPVTVLCHHALVDGIHISQFYAKLQSELEAFYA